jgi:hypothetical protein
VKSLAKDDSRAEEADPGDHLGGHLRCASIVGKQIFEDHKAGRTDRDQRIGPQAGHSLTPLAFESDACAHEGGHTEADGGLINRSGSGSVLDGRRRDADHGIGHGHYGRRWRSVRGTSQSASRPHGQGWACS